MVTCIPMPVSFLTGHEDRRDADWQALPLHVQTFIEEQQRQLQAVKSDLQAMKQQLEGFVELAWSRRHTTSHVFKVDVLTQAHRHMLKKLRVRSDSVSSPPGAP